MASWVMWPFLRLTFTLPCLCSSVSFCVCVFVCCAVLFQSAQLTATLSSLCLHPSRSPRCPLASWGLPTIPPVNQWKWLLSMPCSSSPWMAAGLAEWWGLSGTSSIYYVKWTQAVWIIWCCNGYGEPCALFSALAGSWENVDLYGGSRQHSSDYQPQLWHHHSRFSRQVRPSFFVVVIYSACELNNTTLLLFRAFVKATRVTKCGFAWFAFWEVTSASVWW